MDSKIVFVVLVLIASFALPTLAAFEKDIISAAAVRAVLKKTNTNAMPSEEVISALTGKVVISNAVLEEALFKNVDHRVKGGSCHESCYLGPCTTALISCSCSGNWCYLNSIDM